MLTDPQLLQCRAVDLPGDGQLVDGLKPANRLLRLWADYTIDGAVVVTELGQLLLHGNNGLLGRRHFAR